MLAHLDIDDMLLRHHEVHCIGSKVFEQLILLS